jgi:anti-anti-sigma factor
MPEVLSIVVRELGGGRTVVEVDGEADYDTSPALVRTCADLVERGAVNLVLDLSGLGFCDSSGINALVRIRRQALDLSRVESVFTVFPTVQDALTAAAGDGDGDAEFVHDGNR